MNTQHCLLKYLSQSNQLTSLMLSLPLELFSRAHFHVVHPGLLWHIMLAFTMHMQTQLAVLASANSVWSNQLASDSNWKCRDLLQAMASQAMQRLQHFNSQNISNTLWAFASLNHHPGPMLLKVLQRELVHKLRQFTPQGIENVLWAFATLGHHPGQSQGLSQE